jgi:hypothetical protein
VILIAYGDSKSHAVKELLQLTEKMNEELNFNAFTVVAVSPPSEKLSHEELQKLCQQPRYAVAGYIAPDLIDGPPESGPFALLPQSSNGDGKLVSDAGGHNNNYSRSSGWLQSRDLTGRWKEILRSSSQDEDSAENIIAAIRPDGHVCAVFQKSTVSLSIFLDNIVSVLYLKRKV